MTPGPSKPLLHTVLRRRRRLIRLAFVSLGFCSMLLTPSVYAQVGEEYEYPLKAQFVERFLHFVEWPEDHHTQSLQGPDEFVIGVFGSSPITPHLEDLVHEKSFQQLPMRVIVLTRLEDVADCDVVFIAPNARRRLDEILAATRQAPVLTIGDTPGFAEQGVMINLYQDGEFLRFEVNRAAGELAGLRFRSNLLRLARIVDAEEEP